MHQPAALFADARAGAYDRMRWIPKGLVWGPDGSVPWALHSALQPTPLIRHDGMIRVFVGMRDAAGVSRIGFVDVDSRRPCRVIRVSDRPALDVGEAGDFDDNGVVPCAVVDLPDELRLYYAGYQAGTRVRFFVFAGLARSTDGGTTFQRQSHVPVLDRSDDERCFRVIHSIRHEGDRWRIWYGGGSTWIEEEGRTVPSYDVRYTESPDGVTFRDSGRICVSLEKDELRIGRPYVIRSGDCYEMYFSVQARGKAYGLGRATSSDGLIWNRRDLAFAASSGRWDDQMRAYPAVVQTPEASYLFYNGNEMGRAGFGYAKWDGCKSSS